MAEVLFRAKLTRHDSSTPWGFRLQGGADFNKPLTLLKVVEESVAAKGGLHASDILVKLAGRSAEGMTHKDAQEAIIAAGNALEIIVERAEVTIQSPPSTPQPRKASEKAKGSASVPTGQTEELQPVEDDDSSSVLSLQSLQPAMTTHNIPHSDDEATSSVMVTGTGVQDRDKSKVNPHHKPGAKRPEVPEEDEGEPHVPEEKLLTTADESRLSGRGQTNQSPIPPPDQPLSSSVAWRPKIIDAQEEGNIDHTDSEVVSNLLQDSCYQEERQMTSVKVTSITTPEHEEETPASYPHEYREMLVLSTEKKDDSHSRGERSRQRDVYPWRHVPQFDTRGHDRQTVDLLPGVERAPASTEGGVSTDGYDADEDQQRHLADDQHVTPSLTVVGRRTSAPTSAADASTRTRSPLISVTPTSPPTGLTVLPVEHLSHYQPPAVSTSLPYDLPQLTREMSDIQQEVKRLSDYHSPRLDDIHFSTGGPDIVDIPMPAVKEMVEDLNRRLEAIAAQQPQIAQPPTAQELGLSYLNVHARTLSDEEDPNREIFIDMTPANVALESFKQKYMRDSEDPSNNSYQKLYDVSSPVGSPTMHRKAFSALDRVSPNSRNQRRVHFADPPEQSVIEIEGRSRRRRDRRKDRDRQEPKSLPEQQTLDTGKHGTTWCPSSSANYAATQGEGPMPYISSSLSPLSSSSSSSPSSLPSSSTVSVPIIIERPAQKAGGQAYATYEAMFNHPDPATVFSSEPAMPANYLQQQQQTPGQISVSITHKKGDQGAPTRLAFTLPSAQPGQPTHFRYTMSGTGPHQPPQTKLSSQTHTTQQSDSGLTYSLPPRYEDSMRTMSYGYGQSSYPLYDDPRYMEGLARAQAAQRSSAQLPGLYGQQAGPLYVDTTVGPTSPPRTSPIYSTPQNPRGFGYRVSPTETEDAVQSKSFRTLDAVYSDGSPRQEESNMDPNMRVKVLGSPSEVLQPAALGRPFTQQPGEPQVQEAQPIIPGPPMGALPGPPPPGMEMAGAAIAPGLFALFDSSFTDKFLQWQQRPRTHFESETYKLVHEIEDVQKKYRGGNH